MLVIFLSSVVDGLRVNDVVDVIVLLFPVSLKENMNPPCP